MPSENMLTFYAMWKMVRFSTNVLSTNVLNTNAFSTNALSANAHSTNALSIHVAAACMKPAIQTPAELDLLPVSVHLHVPRWQQPPRHCACSCPRSRR